MRVGHPVDFQAEGVGRDTDSPSRPPRRPLISGQGRNVPEDARRSCLAHDHDDRVIRVGEEPARRRAGADPISKSGRRERPPSGRGTPGGRLHPRESRRAKYIDNFARTIARHADTPGRCRRRVARQVEPGDRGTTGHELFGVGSAGAESRKTRALSRLPTAIVDSPTRRSTWHGRDQGARRYRRRLRKDCRTVPT